MGAAPPSLADVYRARRTIAGKLRPTPLARSDALGARLGAPVHLKLEQHQITGSFKLRGASNAVAHLTPAQRAAGVVGISTGNHGRGLAYAAKEAGVRCIVCMSELVPQNKVAGVRGLGAEVRIRGRSQDDAEIEAERLIAAEAMTLVHPFDDAQVIAGQGTLGLEIVEDLPEVEAVVVPLSGGGLISGVALAVKAVQPRARVVGVTMERGAAMYESQRAGEPVPVEELPSLADALGGGIGMANRYTFAMVRDLVDDMVLVSEDEIAEAIRHAYRQERQIVEGSGAVGIAALLAGKVEARGPMAVVVSGGNIDMAEHARIVAGARGS
jgi:threonine dehydratase